MKKLFFPLLAAAAIAMTSCSSKNAEANAESVDEGADLKAKIENCSDPDSLAIYVQQAKEYADRLVAEGDEDAAKSYIEEVLPVVTEKAPASVNLLDVLKSYVTSTVDSTVSTAAQAEAGVVDAATSVVEGGKAQAEQAVNNAKTTVDNAKAAAEANAAAAKTAANAAATAAKDKATSEAQNAANTAKTKAANAIQSAADKAKSALGK
jgi:hypothetical protein